MLFNCAIVALTLVAPVLDSGFVYENGDAKVRRHAYALGASILTLQHLWAYLNKETSKRGGSDIVEGVLFIMDSMLVYAFLTDLKGAVLFATIALAMFCTGLLFFPKPLLSLLWQYDEKFFQDESKTAYLMLLHRGIGLALAQSVVLVIALEMNRSPVQSFGFSCIALTTGVLSLPFWNCNAAKVSLATRHLAMGAAGAILSSFMILPPKSSEESSE